MSKGKGIFSLKLAPAIVVLVITLLSTLWAWTNVSRHHANQQRSRFQRESEQTSLALINRLYHYQNVLMGMRGAFSSTDQVTPLMWSTCTDNEWLFSSFPAINTIMFIERPKSDQGQKYPVVYSTAKDGLDSLSGADMYEQPIFRKALQYSMEANLTGLSAPHAKSNLVMMCQPIYKYSHTQSFLAEDRREALLGWLAILMDVDLLPDDIIGKSTEKLCMQIYDGKELENKYQLFTNTATVSDIYRGKQVLPMGLPLCFGGKTWTLVIHPTERFMNESKSLASIMVIPAGFIISLAMFAITLQLSTGRSRATALAQKMTVALRRKAAEAVAASRAKSAFLANMSHEIRTPLNGVVGMVELLKNTGLNKRQDHYVDMAKASAEALLSIINDILDFSKIEAGKFELDKTEFNLQQMVEDTFAMFSPKASAKGLEMGLFITPHLPNPLVGDSDRIRQNIINLVNNAIKFTSEGEITLSVSIEDSKDQASKVKFLVRDTGIGISKDKQLSLFDEFSQADNTTTRKYGGTGLGLAIVKNIAELMGGEVGIESEEGKGSSFFFTVWLSHSTQHKTVMDKLEPIDVNKLNVLAVDDNETNCEILKMQFASWGFDIHTANSADEALEKVSQANDSQQSFNMFLLDVKMDKTDGLELAQELRRDKSLKNSEIIMLSSIDDQDCQDSAKELNIARWLTKPVKQSELLDAIIELHPDAAIGSKPVEQARENDEDLTKYSCTSIVNKDAKILLAEDNEINQDVIHEIFDMAQSSCDMADNGAKAAEAALSGKYQLILMDCHMPEMDGFEATAMIRKYEKEQGPLGVNGKPISIIALTANAIKGDRERCLAAGMDDYLTKPIDPEKLISVINKYLAGDISKTEPFATVKTVTAEDSPIDYEKGGYCPIDTESLLGRCMGRREFMSRILGKFTTQAQKHLETLAGAIDSGEVEITALTAHTIKGVAANLSATKLWELAAELEKLARHGDMSVAKERLNKIKDETDLCIEYINSLAGESV